MGVYWCMSFIELAHTYIDVSLFLYVSLVLNNGRYKSCKVASERRWSNVGNGVSAIEGILNPLCDFRLSFLPRDDRYAVFGKIMASRRVST